MQLGKFLLVSAVMVSSLSFADIIMPGMTVLQTQTVVQGLDTQGRTRDGKTLVVVNNWQGFRATRVENNKPIPTGYKFSSNKAYFVSPEVLASVGGDLNKINYSATTQGVTEAPITLEHPSQVPAGTPIKSKTVIYKVQ